MAGDKTPLIAQTISWRKTGDEAVILNLATSEYYSANETGTFIWELFSSGKRPEKIAESLAAEYGITAEAAAGDVAAFLEELTNLEILVRGKGK